MWEKTLTFKSIKSQFPSERKVLLSTHGTYDTASTLGTDERRQQLKQWLYQCRIGTLALFEGVDQTTFCRQAHLDFSPAGWHLGHIAYTESLWLLERCGGMSPLWTEYRQLFAADGLPKTQRVKLPTMGEVYHYLDAVRARVLDYLETVDLDQQERLWRWLIQHESQHSETIAFLLQLQRWQGSGDTEAQEILVNPPPIAPQLQRGPRQCGQHSPPQTGSQSLPSPSEMVEIPAGEFQMGSDSLDALDNECPAHQMYLETYWIDRHPVTCGQYRTFMEAGGYQNSSWWSASGWEWLQSQLVIQPLYWTNNPEWNSHPVYGVSWYEAEAYAQFVGKRLPTEAEWEKAASWDAAALKRRLYPWGKEVPTNKQGNYAYLGEDNYPPLQTTPVDAYPTGQSAYGCYDMLGNVWEWTASAFYGYEGFASYPYAGYSKVYFDGQHQVLKGGSWATRPWALRCSFRNWYHPGVRQILAGFRCAR